MNTSCVRVIFLRVFVYRTWWQTFYVYFYVYLCTGHGGRLFTCIFTCICVQDMVADDCSVLVPRDRLADLFESDGREMTKMQV